MFFKVSRFCMPWKSHRYYACGQTILFMNSPDWGRCYCEREDESRSRQPLGTDCLRSYLLCVSASIKGRPSSPTGWFEASTTSLLALLHADLPTLGAFILITHKYLLEKPQSNFLITPSLPSKPFLKVSVPKLLSQSSDVPGLSWRISMHSQLLSLLCSSP